MGEPRVAVAQAASQVPNPPSTGQTHPPQPTHSTDLPPNSKKRAFECDACIQNTSCFKIRTVIKDLRPHVLEVLRTHDFPNCKASHEIREQLKILIELYQHMRADMGSIKKLKPGDNLNGKTLQEQPPSEIKLSPPNLRNEKKLAEDGEAPGSYIVGGSAFGWNFITFSVKEPAYYGVTKEQFRSGIAPL